MTTSFGLLIIGDEILSGKRADKHMPKVIELLGARGLSLAYADYVGDDPARITATLERAFAAARASGDVVFSCGGIGATPDDHTRQCAAWAWGRELVLHPEAKRLIEDRMRDVAKEQGTPFEPDRHDNQHRLNMGVFPQGAQIIPNPYNKIPGFFCSVERPADGRSAGPPQARPAPSGGSRLLGSDANFASVRSTEPSGPAFGWANLDSDPKNRRGGLYLPLLHQLRRRQRVIAFEGLVNPRVGGQRLDRVVSLKGRHALGPDDCAAQLSDGLVVVA